MKRLDIGSVVFCWTVFASVGVLLPFIYFTAKVGLWHSHADKDLIVVPAEIEQLDTVWRSLKCGTRVSANQYCFLTNYRYVYQGKEYSSTKVSAGYFVTTKHHAEVLRQVLLKRASAYVSTKHPAYSVLLNRTDFVHNQPHDFSAHFWFSPFLQLPMIGLLLAFLWPKKEEDADKLDIRYKYSAIFFRLTSVWCDVSLFVAVVGIYIGLTGIFSLSAYHEATIITFADLPLVFLGFCFLYRMVFLRSFGMQCANLCFVNAATYDKVSRPTIAIHFLLSLVTFVLSAGLVLIWAVFNKKKQTLADKLCGVVVIQPFINEKYADRKRMLVGLPSS